MSGGAPRLESAGSDSPSAVAELAHEEMWVAIRHSGIVALARELKQPESNGNPVELSRSTQRGADYRKFPPV